FGREAAAEVAGVSLRILAALVDKSLLTRGQGGRYGLHELLRGYALERLREDEDEEREVLGRHCAYYAAFAKTRAERLIGADQEAALEELREDHGNLRAAWGFALGEFDEGALAGLIDGLHRFYEIGGRFQEGKELFAGAIGPLRARGEGGLILAKVLVRAGRFLHALGASREARPLVEEGLALARGLGDARETAFALASLGELVSFLGDHPVAEGLLREALGLYRELGDRAGIAAALNALGTVAWRQGRYEDAKALYQEGLALERELGDRRGMALSLNNLGIIHGLLGELEEARGLFTEGLAISEELGDLPSMSRCLNNLGVVAMKLGDLERARAFHERGLAIERETGNRAGIAGSLSNLGNLAYRMGEYGEAKRLYRDSLRVRRETGDSLGEIISLMNLCEVCFAVGEEEEGVGYLREGLGRALEVGAHPLVLGCLAKLAGHLMRRGEWGRAAELLGLVLHHPALEIDAKEEVEDLLPKLRDAMSPEELERALERGRGLDPEEVARGFLTD
ncbi:MAG: tetratricopeptide repeat protein, partial [Caldiserica bacterium]|nr:tetratricopeptide repeat protein [Caldisericota bacterium]